MNPLGPNENPKETHMINLLALDTTTDAFSVALRYNGSIFHHFEVAARQHTVLALPTIDRLLQQAGITLKDLDVIAVTRGPGGFAGVRTGISLVQGLAFSVGLPVIGISTLALLAQKAFRLHQATHVITALDARQHELYWATYIHGALDQPEQVVSPDQAPLSFQERVNWHIIGSGWDAYSTLLSARSPIPLFSIPNEAPDALDLIPLADVAYQQQLTQSPLLLTPVYLRDKVTQ